MAVETDRPRMPGICGELGEALKAAVTAPSGAAREALYERYAPLVRELEQLTKPPLPVKKITPLIREFHWHFRSLAGLAAVNASSDDEHAAWARSSLERLEKTIPFPSP